MRAVLVGLLTIHAIAGAAFAEGLRLRDGTRVEGTIVDADAAGVVLRTPEGAERRVPAGDVTPEAHYAALVEAFAPCDSVTRVGLAEVCLEAGLFGPARTEAQRAATDDATVAMDAAHVLARADEGEARDTLVRGLEALSRGAPDAATLLLVVVNRFPATGAMPAAVEALRRWRTAASPGAEPAAALPAPPDEPPAALKDLVAGALKRAQSDRVLGEKAPVDRGDARERAFEAAETELVAAARAVAAWRSAGRVGAAPAEGLAAEVRAAHVALAISATSALLASGRSAAARRACYHGLTLAPDDPTLLALQVKVTAATFSDPDPWRMGLTELTRRVGSGTATREMRRAYERRTGNPPPPAGADGR